MLITLVVTILFFAIFWLVHLRVKDAGIVDVYWGPGFAVIAVISVIISREQTPFQLIILITTIVWALRIAGHIGVRHYKSIAEDKRYALMRKKTGSSFWWLSLFKIFILQAVLMWIIATPQHVGLLHASTVDSFMVRFIFYIGLVAFISGFFIESVADWQLIRFKACKENQNRTMTQGLWAYSRHPNYFGEVVLWWGLGFMGFASGGSLFAFIGPALLTFLILKVSGVTMLEKHLEPEKEGYKDYINTTSAFFPMRRK